MGQPSSPASNALIYVTYALFLVLGLVIAWRIRNQSKAGWLSANGSQRAIPLALNFVASALGSGILFIYPEISTIAGVQGLIIYAVSSSVPLLVFGWLGPIIRRKCPEGFVLTEWTRQRYGAPAALYLSAATLLTLFLYMVGELSALQQIVNALTGLNGLPAVIVQCLVTTIYTSLAGFRVSFYTDNVQGSMVILIIILCIIAIGSTTNIDRSLIRQSGYLDPSLLGWQLIYILPVALITNSFFLSSFWLRTFASRTDKDLRIGTGIAAFVILIILTFVGSTGLIATWSGVWPGSPPQSGSIALFLLLAQLPSWVVAIVLVATVSLSTAAFDSLQTAMISTASNDLFRNRLNLWIVKASVVVLIVPVVVVALKSPSVLRIFLISDLLSAAIIPILILGLSSRFHTLRGFDIVVGGLGGVFTVFLFGLVYYADQPDTAHRAAQLLILTDGLYADDWSAFGAFVAAPLGGFLWGAGAWTLRVGILWVLAKMRGTRFDALDGPSASDDDAQSSLSMNEDGVLAGTIKGKDGRFFA